MARLVMPMNAQENMFKRKHMHQHPTQKMKTY